MPRVPFIEGSSVEATPVSGYRPREVRANTSVQEGIASLGRGLESGAIDIERAVGRRQQEDEKAAQLARREGEAVAEADAMLEFDSANLKDLGEFKKLKGRDADANASGVVGSMSERRQKIAENLSAGAKARFMARSADSLMVYARQVEAHSGQEFEAARVGLRKATQDMAVNKAEAGLLTEPELTVFEVDAVKSIRDLQRSEEEGTAEISDFQSRVAAAYVSGLVSQGRNDEASSYVERNRGVLGGRSIEAKALVDRANAGAEKDRMAGEVAELVDTSAEAVRSPDGYVTEDELRKAVPVEGYEGQQRDTIERELQQRIVLEDRRLKADISKNRDNVNRADLNGGKDGDAELFLEKYDPDFLLARAARKRAETRAYKAFRGDTRAAAAEARAQRAVDKEFLSLWTAELYDNPNADRDEFLTGFIAEKAKAGDDVTVSDVALAGAKANGAKFRKRDESADGAKDRQVAADFDTFLSKAFKEKGKPLDQKLLKERVGKALSEYHDKVEAKGKPLDPDELAALKAGMLEDKKETVPRKILGVEFGTKDVTKKAIDLILPRAKGKDGVLREKRADGKWYPVGG